MARTPYVAPDEELVGPEETIEDRAHAGAMRPESFDEYVGQRHVLEKLQVYVKAARQRSEALDHVLLHGPPGLGKTTLAVIIANEMGVGARTTSGPAVEHRGVLAGLLTSLKPNEVLFIDEIHRLSPAVEENLYSAMEDGRIDLAMGEGNTAITHSLELAPFTLIGATTRTALLSGPLRDRFHIVEELEFYGDEELASIVSRSAKLLGRPADEDAALEIGRRSRGTPRVANRLTRRVRDFSQVAGHERITRADAREFLAQQGIDDLGLNKTDRRLLKTVIELFSGGPVGIDALAASMGLPRDTLEDVHEPFLLQRGMLVRTPRGRMTTARAAEHLGLPDPKAGQGGSNNAQNGELF